MLSPLFSLSTNIKNLTKIKNKRFDGQNNSFCLSVLTPLTPSATLEFWSENGYGYLHTGSKNCAFWSEIRLRFGELGTHPDQKLQGKHTSGHLSRVF